MDPCFLKEKQMDSMGPIPFLRDILCTVNTTCYKESQINWTKVENYDFQILLHNISIVYKTFPKSDINVSTIINWVFTHPNDFQILKYSIDYTIHTFTPLLRALQMIMSHNYTLQRNGLEELSTIICGDKNNDLDLIFDIFKKMNDTRIKRSSKYSCATNIKKYFNFNLIGKSIYHVVAPIICGNIYFTPNSKFTELLMSKANNTFVILDKIRLLSIEWRINFKEWLEPELINGTFFNNLRNLFAECEKLPYSKIAELCTLTYNMLNETNIKSSVNIASLIFSIIENILNIANLNKFVPLKSSADIDNLLNDSMINVFAALVLDSSFQYIIPDNATLLNYAIRIPTNRIDSTKRFKVLDRFWTPNPRVNTIVDMKYYTSGFLMIQEAVDRAFIEIVSDNQTVDIGSSMQIMPSPCYVDDRFIRFAANLMPFLLVIAWSPTFSSLVKSIVYEKEMRLKEFMLVMGLSHFMHWVAWFIITMITTLIPSILTTVILKYSGIIEFSSPVLLFLVLFSYIISFISQAFMLSTFFNKANSSAVVSGLLYFVFYIPFVVLIDMQDDITYYIYFFIGILPQVSFSNAINFIAYWEQTKEGAQFSNLLQSTVLNLDFGVGHCIIMLWVDAFLYLIITWYVEAVFPGQYGIAKPWYFFIDKSYWFPDHKKYSLPTYDSAEPVEIDNLNNYFESVSNNLEVGISIQSLTKTFSKCKSPAVDNLNLNFYKSQITAFLGHNGAGKTTTISMLTGIFPPTSGTAFILNQDIRKEIVKIRKSIGLCPQHNILFDNLTVEDHIYFYGLLKGMNLTDIKSKLPKIVDDVGLTKKVKIKSKKLSGGMKRKLSVAMAFIGDSKVIFLDEPTAGVDPFARRGIWDLLIKYRSSEKTIILTTHHMDEADYLSDRIAIISQGKLKCCGSSVFLKRQFGDGYSLILAKSSDAQKEHFTNDDRSLSGNYVFQFIKKHIPNAKFVEETLTQWNIVLPLDDLKDNGFSNLFMDIDASLNMLNVTSYGLSDSSLESVFLNVANDPSQSDIIINKSELEDESLGDEVLLPNVISGSGLTDKLNITNNEKSEDGYLEYNLNYIFLSGFSLLRQQIIALQIKRFHYTKRNFKGFLSELILPILMILLIVTLLKVINPFVNEPSMVIHPWLMMPKARSTNLKTFYRMENFNNLIVKKLTDIYRSDLGESGIRCMNQSVYLLKDYRCYSAFNNKWSNGPKSKIPIESPPCNCNETGYQLCPNPLSGGPLNSFRIMASSDILNNLTGYNISDNLLKRFESYAKKQYGGYQFLLPSNFGLTTKVIGKVYFWDMLRNFIMTSQTNNTNIKAIYFVNYLQDFFKLSGVRTNFTRIWINNKGYVSMPSYVNIFDNLLLRSYLNSSRDPNNYGIVVSTYPFRYSHHDLINLISKQMFIEVSLSNFVILALSLIPASFVLFLIEERVSGSKRQQFVSGINPYVYWISNFCWDIVKYIISALLIIIVFYAFNYQTYIGPKNIRAFIAILCGYGFAIIPHMYPFSFIISTPSTSFVILSAYNMFVGSITTTTTFILDQLQNDEPNLKPVNDILKRFFLVFPQYGLGRGMMDISFKYMQYNISNGQLDYKPFDWEICGKKLASFGILFVFWCIVIYLIESGIIHRRLFGKFKSYKLKNIKTICDEDIDVTLERHRVINDIQNEDILKVKDLTKIYNSTLKCPCKSCRRFFKNASDSENRKLAVNNICFGVRAGECFGLLGVNGAGKTTTFKMLTGEELITKGDAMINGKSIITDLVAAHKDMGFCPQFDALHDLLTCEEELIFYCRIRGIEPSLIDSTVKWSLKSLSLIPHASKTSNTLSGGNKRKLSTAISLIGNPKVIFMDEPTSGMDAGARRFLWNRIKKLTNEQRAVILTSHNMEECEVLCNRLAIMVNGKFQCLGSVQHLKSKFGDDYFVTLRMHSNCDEIGEREKVKSIMDNEFVNGMYLKDENLVSIQYRIDPSIYKLYKIFEFFENLKKKEIILDYSVCQTTLDTIFINFAKNENLSTILSSTNVKNNNVRRTSYLNDGFDNADLLEVIV